MLQVRTLTRRDVGANFDLVMSLHRLRARVFKDRLDWDVTVAGDMEMDVYDTLDPAHLAVVSPEREVVGCVRLLATTGPNMLADTFSDLLDGQPAPCDPGILESSRFCVDTQRSDEIGGAGLRQATFLLFEAMLATAMRTGCSALATVTDVRMERILRRAGWPLDRLGSVHELDGTKAVAGLLPVSAEYLNAVRKASAPVPPIGPSKGVRRLPREAASSERAAA